MLSRAALLIVAFGAACLLACALLWPSCLIIARPLVDEKLVVEEWSLMEQEDVVRSGVENVLKVVEPALKMAGFGGSAGTTLVTAVPVIAGIYPPAGAVAASVGGALVTASAVATQAAPFLKKVHAFADGADLMEAMRSHIGANEMSVEGIVHKLLDVRRQLKVIEKKLNTISDDTLWLRMEPQKTYFMRADTLYRTMLQYVKNNNTMFDGDVHSWYQELLPDTGYFGQHVMMQYLKLVLDRRGPAAAAVMFQEASIARLHVLNICLAAYETKKLDTKPLLSEYADQMIAYNDTLEELKLNHWARLSQEYLQSYITQHGNKADQLHISKHWDRLMKAIKNVSNLCHEEGMTYCQHTNDGKKAIETHSRCLQEIGHDGVKPVSELLRSDLFAPPNPIYMQNVWCKTLLTDRIPAAEPAPPPAAQPAALTALCATMDDRRVDCGHRGINADTCQQKGCCWAMPVNSTPESGIPQCFFKRGEAPHEAQVCAIPDDTKKECGFDGITDEQCRNKGCCYMPQRGVRGVPFCFFKRGEAPHDAQVCAIPDDTKKECGYDGITNEQCRNKGCCYVPKRGVLGVPFCFFKPAQRRLFLNLDAMQELEASFPPAGSDFGCTVDNQCKMLCGDDSISVDACHSLGCCYATEADGAPKCYHKKNRDWCRPRLAADSLKRRWIVHALLHLGQDSAQLVSLLKQKLEYTDRNSPYYKSYWKAMRQIELTDKDSVKDNKYSVNDKNNSVKDREDSVKDKKSMAASLYATFHSLWPFWTAPGHD